MGNVVIFGNQKGGVGKSTLAVLYACWLADVRRRSVCVIDLDAQANSSKSLNQSSAIAEAVELFGQDLGPIAPPRERTIALAAGCPIELEEYSIHGVADMLRTVFGVRRRYNPQLRMAAIVLNRFNPHSLRQKAAMQDLALNFREFVIPARISTRSAIPEALAAGVPVWRLPKSAAREASLEVMRVFELLQQRIDGSNAPMPADTQA
ncbi:MAG: ParA family protein [Variovorax paradoxus]|nr:ParA family protein [Variovorax paradoxus]MBW8714693.1 ParA family protein [Variovorax paradoxus]